MGPDGLKVSRLGREMAPNPALVPSERGMNRFSRTKGGWGDRLSSKAALALPGAFISSSSKHFKDMKSSAHHQGSISQHSGGTSPEGARSDRCCARYESCPLMLEFDVQMQKQTQRS